HAVAFAQRCHHDRYHLRYSDADIARSHEDPSPKITKRDLGPSRERRVQFLEISNIVLVETTLELQMKGARDGHLFEFDTFKLIAGTEPAFIRKPAIDLSD